MKSQINKFFEIWWQAYPKKVGKLYAEKCFARLKPTQNMLEQMLAALKWQIPIWAKDEPRFIPNPSTWLNQGRWLDEPPVKLPTLEESDKQQQSKLTEKQAKENAGI